MRAIGIWALAAIAALPQSVSADSFGEWRFSPPEGYEHEVTRLGMTYKGANGVFVFPPSKPARGATLAALAPGLVTEMTEVPASGQTVAASFAPEDGGEARVIVASDGATVFIAAVFLRDDRVAAALFIPGSAEIDAERDALLDITFEPADAATPAGPPAPADAWPAPLADRTAATRPRLSVAEAARIGLDADAVPLPGGFSCFRTEKPRALTPEPDLMIEFHPAMTYDVSGSGRTGQGTWSMGSNDTFDHLVNLTGTLENNGYIILNSDELGQTFRIDDPFAGEEQELTCRQNGPATETLVQAMARIAVDKGSFACIDMVGENAWRLNFANGTYSAPEGFGALDLAAESYSGDEWDLAMNFATGPLALYSGKLEADPSGLLRLALSTEWRTGSMFYSSSETTIHATCTMMGAPRPAPIYGLDPPPPAPAPAGGLPEGLFRSFEGSYSYAGTMPTYIFREMLTVVAPGGRILHDVDLDDIGALPDCTRSRPDGYAFCGDYRIDGTMIRLRDPGAQGEDGWADPEPLAVTADGFRIGGTEYARIVPMAAASLAGTWVGDDFTGGGPGLGGGVGVYTDADVWWQFGADGRFAWREASTTTTMISPDPILGGAMGGGSSSSQDGGEGTYAFDGLWLTLTFDDGRTKRLTVLPSADDSGLVQGLVIGGRTLKRG